MLPNLLLLQKACFSLPKPSPRSIPHFSKCWWSFYREKKKKRVRERCSCVFTNGEGKGLRSPLWGSAKITKIPPKHTFCECRVWILKQGPDLESSFKIFAGRLRILHQGLDFDTLVSKSRSSSQVLDPVSPATQK